MPTQTTYAAILSTLMAVSVAGCDEEKPSGDEASAPAAGGLHQLLPAAKKKVSPKVDVKVRPTTLGKTDPNNVQPLDRPAIEVTPGAPRDINPEGACGEASCGADCGGVPGDPELNEVTCGASCGAGGTPDAPDPPPEINTIKGGPTAPGIEPPSNIKPGSPPKAPTGVGPGPKTGPNVGPGPTLPNPTPVTKAPTTTPQKLPPMPKPPVHDQ